MMHRFYNGDEVEVIDAIIRWNSDGMMAEVKFCTDTGFNHDEDKEHEVFDEGIFFYGTPTMGETHDGDWTLVAVFDSCDLCGLPASYHKGFKTCDERRRERANTAATEV